MKKYKHYSFDLWLTLIKSNPLFKEMRAQYFFEHFNRQGMSIEEVGSIIKGVDKMCNSVNEKVGYNIDAFEMYTMVLHHLEYDFKNFQFRDIHSIYHNVEQIYFKYPPEFYDNDTKRVLEELKFNQRATLSILSNTGFIKSHTLKQFLVKTGLGRYFDFQIYSDEVGLSKPNEQLFRHMTNAVHAMRQHHPVIDSEIIHIGDNPLADIQGAEKAGIDSFLINSNDKTIKDILV